MRINTHTRPTRKYRGKTHTQTLWLVLLGMTLLCFILWEQATTAIASASSGGTTQICWQFDGNFNSTGGAQYDGVAPGGGDNNATTTAQNPSPAGGQSLLLDGDSDYLTVGNPLPATGSYTKAMFVRRAGPNVDGEWENLYTSGDPVGPHGLLIDPSAGMNLHVYHRNDTGGLSHQDTGQAIPSNQWVHVAVVYDSGADTFTTYYNGSAVDTQTSVGTLGTMTSADNIGAYAGMQSWFNGQLDDVCVFDRALTANEIAQLSAGPTTVSMVDTPNAQAAFNRLAITTVTIVLAAIAAVLHRRRSLL